MKHLFFFFLILFSPLLYASEEVITPELLTLLDHFHLQHEGTLSSINEATQKAWLRPPKTERWETPDMFSLEDRKAVLEYYIKTGKFEERRPSKTAYQYGVLCGATTFRMKSRIQFFEKLGLQVGEVVLLSGARPLDPKADEMLPDCQTEGDAFMVFWKASPLFSKTSWKHLQHPMVALDDGSFRRPGAPDIFAYWIKKGLKAGPIGDAVIVANQPYCCYFEAVAEGVLPQTIEFEVVGSEANPDSQTTNNLLDNLARWIYAKSISLKPLL